MKLNLLTANSSYTLPPLQSVTFTKTSNSLTGLLPLCRRPHTLLPLRCSSTPHTSPPHLSNPISQNSVPKLDSDTNFSTQIATASVPSFLSPPKLSLSDQAFYLLSFIACTVCSLYFVCWVFFIFAEFIWVSCGFSIDCV